MQCSGLHLVNQSSISSQQLATVPSAPVLRIYRVSKTVILLVTGWFHINCEAHTCGIFKSLSSSPWGKVRTQKWFLCMESSPRRYLIIKYDVQWQYNVLKNIIPFLEKVSYFQNLKFLSGQWTNEQEYWCSQNLSSFEVMDAVLTTPNQLLKDSGT